MPGSPDDLHKGNLDRDSSIRLLLGKHDDSDRSPVVRALLFVSSYGGTPSSQRRLCKDEAMTLSSSEYLAMAIGAAIGGGGDHQYEATSTSQHGNVIEQWAIVVVPGTFYWSARSLGTGRIQSFDPNTLSLHDGEESRQLSLDRIPRSFPEPVKLAFPLSLPIWGRHRDEYHPISVEDQDNDTVFLLRHQKDKSVFGSFTFDRETGRAKRLVTPTQLLDQDVKLLDSSGGPGVSFGFVAGMGMTVQH